MPTVPLGGDAMNGGGLKADAPFFLALFRFAEAKGVFQTDPLVTVVIFDSGGVLRADGDWHRIGA